MSAGLVVLFVGFVLGALTAGEAWYRLRRSNEFMRGVLAGQHQAEVAHGHRPSPVDVKGRGHDAWALLDTVRTESPRRPVFHDRAS